MIKQEAPNKRWSFPLKYGAGQISMALKKRSCLFGTDCEIQSIILSNTLLVTKTTWNEDNKRWTSLVMKRCWLWRKSCGRRHQLLHVELAGKHIKRSPHSKAALVDPLTKQKEPQLQCRPWLQTECPGIKKGLLRFANKPLKWIVGAFACWTLGTRKRRVYRLRHWAPKQIREWRFAFPVRTTPKSKQHHPLTQ